MGTAGCVIEKRLRMAEASEGLLIVWTRMEWMLFDTRDTPWSRAWCFHKGQGHPRIHQRGTHEQEKPRSNDVRKGQKHRFGWEQKLLILLGPIPRGSLFESQKKPWKEGHPQTHIPNMILPLLQLVEIFRKRNSTVKGRVSFL